MKDGPIIVAHRGLHQKHPENSLASFEAAWASGISWCECDVHLTVDRIPVVLHDNTLDRTTTGSGSIESVSSLALSSSRLRRANGVQTDQPVPGLSDVVKAMPEEGHLLVEIKPSDHPVCVDTVVTLLQKSSRRWMIQSFDAENVIRAIVADPTAQFAFLVEDHKSVEIGLGYRWTNLHIRHDLLDKHIADQIRSAGGAIGVWTPNAEADLRRVIDLGVDMIITDEPLLARRLVDERDGIGKISGREEPPA